jgi:hypothetical protein
MLRQALARSARLAPSFPSVVAATAVGAATVGAGAAFSAFDDDDNPFAPGSSAASPPPTAATAADDEPGPSPWSKSYSSPSASAVVPAGMTPQLRAGRNVVLGDPNVAEELRPHRVALCEWPADQAKHNGEARTSSPRILFRWLKKNGYDGMECTAPWMASKFFANMPMDDVAVRTAVGRRSHPRARSWRSQCTQGSHDRSLCVPPDLACLPRLLQRAAKAAADQQGMKIFGANVWWCFDCGWDDGSIIQEMKEQVRLTKLMGGEYVSFQMWLKPEAMGDCGAYRRDEPYLDEVARRIEKLHQLCFEQGMNCCTWRLAPATPPFHSAPAALLAHPAARTLARSHTHCCVYMPCRHRDACRAHLGRPRSVLQDHGPLPRTV